MRTIDWEHLVDTLLCVDVCSVATVSFIESVFIASGETPAPAGIFMGMQQHQWNTIHSILSSLLLILIVLHIFFNSPWEIDSKKKYLGDRWRKSLFMTTGVWLVILVVFWLTLRP